MTDKTYINIAECIAKESKCISLKVGAIIIKDDRIISTGYNGTAKDYPNCNDLLEANEFTREEHHNWSSIYEIHAEMNAILFAAKHGISIEGSTLYCTHKPCDQCIKNIVQSGIKRVIYKYNYKPECCISKYNDIIDIYQYADE